MKKVRFLFMILALILVVGMTTGLIVRKQTGGQTVMQHSAQGPAQTTPATTGDDEPAAPESEATVAKILLLVNHDEDHPVVVMDNGVEIDPIDTYWINGEPSIQSAAKPASGSNHVPFDRYLVTPGSSSFTIQRSLNAQNKGGESSEEEESFDVYEFSISVGSLIGEIYLPCSDPDSITAGEPFSIDEGTFCVLVNFDEYTFVSD